MGGRPTKYRKEHCDVVVNLMKKGWSKVEVCAQLEIDYHTFLSWQEKHKPFLQSVKRGDKLSEAWWMGKGRISLNDSTFNSTLWYMNMKNRHGWADKTELRTPDGIDLNVNTSTKWMNSVRQSLKSWLPYAPR
ncbi:MAG: hypothetical protein JRC68_10135 [Deltaproteobacteria bacterium]|nr:hypothetical protein [Deltaproteobacteria bacterium]